MDFALNFDEQHKFEAPGPQPLSLQQKYFELKIEQLKLFEYREDTKNFEKTKKEILTIVKGIKPNDDCLLYTSPSPRDRQKSRMPSSA